MKILVAGGAGYVGTSLIPLLLERGYEVEVVDLLWFDRELPPQVNVIRKEILEVQQEELEVYDQVIFLAGLSNDPMAEFSPGMNFVFNAAAPAYLAYIAKRAGVKRFIYASSCSIYGYTADELMNEDSAVDPIYPYGISKLQGEEGVFRLAGNDFSVISLRKGTVCGYSPRMRLDLVVNTMFKTAVADRVIRVHNPSIWRPILSIDDAVTAYIRAVEAYESISGIFNISSGNYTVGEIGDLVKHRVEKLMGIDVKLEINHIQDYRNYKVSIEKAQNVLSFKPTHDVQSIVTQLVDNHDRFKDFDNPKYYNIRVFKEISGAVQAMMPKMGQAG